MARRFKLIVRLRSFVNFPFFNQPAAFAELQNVQKFKICTYISEEKIRHRARMFSLKWKYSKLSTSYCFTFCNPGLFGQPAKLETLWLSLDLLDFCFQISWISDVSAFPDATFLKMRKWRIKERHCAENSSWSSAITSNIYPNTIPFHPGKEKDGNILPCTEKGGRIL